MGEPLLLVEGLSKAYRPRTPWLRSAQASRPALIDANLMLHRGEILGIVGESGSGKSTLARCIALLERPDKGRVVFRGEDLTLLRPAALRQRRRLIQTIFQDPYASLNPRLTVGGAIGEVIRVHRLAPADRVASRVADLLGRVGLPAAAAYAYPKSLSGGQRQRVCIARALAAEPDILIADEPVSSLDVSVQAQVVNLLLELSESSGLAILFIGHDLPLIDAIARRTIVLLSGEVVETLDEHTPLDAARHAYTRALLSAAPTLAPSAPGGPRPDS